MAQRELELRGILTWKKGESFILCPFPIPPMVVALFFLYRLQNAWQEGKNKLFILVESPWNFPIFDDARFGDNGLFLCSVQSSFRPQFSDIFCSYQSTREEMMKGLSFITTRRNEIHIKWVSITHSLHAFSNRSDGLSVASLNLVGTSFWWVIQVPMTRYTVGLVRETNWNRSQ